MGPDLPPCDFWHYIVLTAWRNWFTSRKSVKIPTFKYFIKICYSFSIWKCFYVADLLRCKCHDERWIVFPQQTRKMNFTDGRQTANRLSQQNSLVASGSDICSRKRNCDYFSLAGCRMSAVLCVQGLVGTSAQAGCSCSLLFFFCLTINAEENLHPSVLLKEGKQSAWGVKGSDLFGSCSAPANTAESLQFPAVPWGYHFICVFSCA